MRVESERRAGNGGWLHPLDAESKARIATAKQPASRPQPFDPSDYESARKAMTFSQLKRWANALNLSPESLIDVGAAAEDRRMLFPMVDEQSRVIGIRTRDRDGNKRAFRGSRNGLFRTREIEKEIVIAEGPTDLTAASMLGFTGIARPSCSAGNAMVVSFCKLNKIRRVTVIADHDDVGFKGARELLGLLTAYYRKLWVPPKKDLRESVKAGLEREEMESMTKSILWERPNE